MRKWGEPRRVNWAKEHFELGEALGQMDFETAAKLSGSRFVVLKEGLARMERALGQFMLDLHTTEHGYTEVQPPLLVKDDVLFGTGQLPKFAEDQFQRPSRVDVDAARCEQLRRAVDDCSDTIDSKTTLQSASTHSSKWTMRAFAVDIADYRSRTGSGSSPPPKSRSPISSASQILAEDELPLRFTALTPCFRSEAGSAGKDTRGMLRQHQFDKVELVSITTPEKSLEEHERMTTCAEEVLRQLDLAYRVMVLSTGDMGFARAEDLRPGGLAAGPEGVSRDLLLLGLRRFPGAAHAGALPAARTRSSRASSTR